MTEERIITCINCPMGCRMTVTLEDGQVTKVSGNTCKRGDTYAHQECTMPVRMVTAVVPVEGSIMPVSVKTREPIPKSMISDCMHALSQVQLHAPVSAGQSVIENVCGSGIDVIATRSIA